MLPEPTEVIPPLSAPPAWHARGTDDALRALSSDARRGLDDGEAERRFHRDGPNELHRGERISPLTIFARQFASLVIWVLIGAALVAGLLGEALDAGAILAIVVLNACFGFVQEYRAEQAMAALARMTAPRARVIRGGTSRTVATAEVVRGDLLALEAGDLVAADARLLEAFALLTTEAPLTGESEPVEKRCGICAAETPLAERRNMVFLGTSVATGTARAVVVATGMGTEVGRIATLLETATREETPLVRRLDHVARQLLLACSAIVVLVFVLGLARSIPPFEIFLGAVSLAVAAIPEGLPAVVTIALALGVSRMARRNALVRRLPAVETLGSAEVICTDKTGTLTVGEMTVRRLLTADGVFTVTGEGYSTDGAIFFDGAAHAPSAQSPVGALLECAVGCVDAEIIRQASGVHAVGDPTEAALLVAAAKAGIERSPLEEAMPRVAVLPFDSDRKRMSIIRRRGEEIVAYVKGAPELLLERCSHILTARGRELLDDDWRSRMLEAIAVLAGESLRVLGFATRRLDSWSESADVESSLTLIGFAGLQDPPRPEAREAVARCKRAGIRTVMITGDHPSTATAVAHELGILGKDDQVVSGAELERMSDERLRERVRSVAVYARVTAEHKLRVVRAWKHAGVIVAMTGDGVNDAPALKEASIGVAMGRTGTEVTKEAADMVIADDNFASIVAAVEEGRGIYDNIRKSLGYLLAGNAAELAVVLVALVVGWPLPLLPIQLLWINLVTDGLPALALATDPVDAHVLERPPRPANAEIMDRPFVMRMLLTAGLTAAVTLAAFGYELDAAGGLAEARDAAFSVLIFAELFRSLGARSDDRGLHEIGLSSNTRLLAIVAASFVVQLLMQYVPILRDVFGTRPVPLATCMTWTAIATIPLFGLEMLKLWQRRRSKSSPS